MFTEYFHAVTNGHTDTAWAIELTLYPDLSTGWPIRSEETRQNHQKDMKMIITRV